MLTVHIAQRTLWPLCMLRSEHASRHHRHLVSRHFRGFFRLGGERQRTERQGKAQQRCGLHRKRVEGKGNSTTVLAPG